MILRAIRSLGGNDSGAISPMYAVAILTLTAMAGIGFDYGRMVALDTELQNAADQAALAAATQLDGSANARDRAIDAATDAFARAGTGFFNETRFANDKKGRQIGDDEADLEIKFYPSEADAPNNQSTGDTDAKVVEVTVNARRVNYALTPLIGALFDDMIGRAMATLQDSVCKIPPLMVCNPNEATGGTFPTAADEGKGLRLEPGPSNDMWGPGNYGFLNLGERSDLEKLLGANVELSPCYSMDELRTQPGAPTSLSNAINTRFDIFDNGLVAYCGRGTGNCSPALNTRKDLVHKVFTGNITNPECRVHTSNGNSNDDGDVSTADFTGNMNGWVLPPTSSPPKNMGFPRDTCHASSYSGTCSGVNFGDKIWDYSLYFQVNHGGSTMLSQAASDIGKSASSLTRYDIYKWEIDKGHLSDGADIRNTGNGNGGNVFKSYSRPMCATGRGEDAAAGIKDRRVLTIAVINCTAQRVRGATDITSIHNWADVFLVEPSVNRSGRTRANQIYVEVIGPGHAPGRDTGFQYYGRKKAVLVR